MTTANVIYAGVSLPVWTPAADAMIARMGIRLAEVYRFNDKPDLNVFDHLPFPPRVEHPPVRGGVLWWPTGASQFARVHYLCDATKLAAIQAALVALAGSADAGYPPATLTISDGRGGTPFSGAMHFLPPIPILGNARLYLLTLVDERYWWWFKAAVDLSAVTTWTGMYSALGTGLGATVTVDGSLSGFAAPSTRWADLGDESLPLLLDAAAWSTGRRIIRLPNGAVHATDYATAGTASFAIEAGWGTTYRHRAGGQASNDNARKNAPAGVVIRGAGTERIVTLAALALTEYSTVTGKAGYQATVNVDSATLTAPQAAVIASEWYKWLLADEDVSFAGVAGFDPCGWWGAVEWIARKDEWATRVLPYPLLLGHSWGGESDSPPHASPPTALDEVLFGYHTVTGTISTVLEAVVPSDGTYMVSYTATYAMDGFAGNWVASFLALNDGTVDRYYSGASVPLFLQVDGEAGGSCSATIPLGLVAGEKVRIMAYWCKPTFGTDPTTVLAIGNSGPGTPGLAGVTSPSLMETRISLCKLSADPGGAVSPPPVGAGRLRGIVVYDDSSPVVGRTVTLSGATSGSTTTAADGGYSISGVIAGSNTVTLSTPGGETCAHNLNGTGYVSGFSQAYTQTADETQGVRFRVTPATGSVSGHAQTSLASPVTFSTVTLSGTSSATTTTDASGNYSFGTLPDGSHTVTLSLGGGVTATNSVDGGGFTAGNAGTFTVAGDAHTVDFHTVP